MANVSFRPRSRPAQPDRRRGYRWVMPGDMTLDSTVSRRLEGKDGQSGMLLLSDNQDAFAARVHAARNAIRSLDLMYYLWHDDHTGRLLTEEVIKAADRGVKVRMLLDDINPRGNDATYLALDAHPNISLRLFNPSKVRSRGLLRFIEILTRMTSMTRRMHNKAWIADGQIAIVGGRNIGDAYFDAAETNFRDLDVLLLGVMVVQTAELFEAFWNCAAVKPIQEVNPVKRPSALARHPKDGADRAHLDHVKSFGSIGELIDATGTVHWATEAKLIADPPEKVQGGDRENWLMRVLMPVIETSKTSLEVISPYFIPGRSGVAILADMVRRKVEVSILTNSLAATDVAAVHGAYSNYRVALLKKGIRLFELQPFARRQNISVLGSKGASLHSKAFTVDDRVGFIGSFNFDPRSVSLNTEMGVLFEHEALVAELRRRFSLEIEPESSFSVSYGANGLVWQGEVDGAEKRYVTEPEAGLTRRFIAALVRLLPVEGQL